MDSITESKRLSNLAKRDREAYWEAVQLQHELRPEEFEAWLDSLGELASPIYEEEEW